MLYNIQVSKINTVESFDDSKLPAASIQFVVDYGIRQWLNDGHAQVTEKSHPNEVERITEARKRVEKRVTALRTGHGLPGIAAVSPVLLAQAADGLSDAEMLEAMQLLKAKKAAATKKSAA